MPKLESLLAAVLLRELKSVPESIDLCVVVAGELRQCAQLVSARESDEAVVGRLVKLAEALEGMIGRPSDELIVAFTEQMEVEFDDASLSIVLAKLSSYVNESDLPGSRIPVKCSDLVDTQRLIVRLARERRYDN